MLPLTFPAFAEAVHTRWNAADFVQWNSGKLQQKLFRQELVSSA
jgi:hypothetical protein